ncbi:MAG: hypothetical protein ACSHYB_12340 [Roseibacillus sp.]
MKTPLLLLAVMPLVAFSSCSSVQETAAKLKENTIGTREPKLRLTKADPTRFLPEGTSAQRLLVKKTPTTAPKQKTRLLAKNTLPKKKLSPSAPISKKAPKTPPKKVAPLPPLELPPLPASSPADSKEFRGILPSLDGSNDATFIDIEGKALELPPMNLPEFEEEPDPEAAA